jgi:hypothetical protein
MREKYSLERPSYPTRIRRHLRHAMNLTPDQIWLLVEAASWLLMARTALKILPFRCLSRRLGDFLPPPGSPPSLATRFADQKGAALAAKIRWAIMCAARNVPFQAICFPQALAARTMLRRRGVGSSLHFGATKAGAQGLDAHVWLEAAGVQVTGYPVAADIVEIGCFVHNRPQLNRANNPIGA